MLSIFNILFSFRSHRISVQLVELSFKAILTSYTSRPCITMAATTEFKHPSIGTFTASSAKEGVLQFLGVQYATLKDRFAPPVLKQYPHGSEVDASKIGYVDHSLQTTLVSRLLTAF